MNRLSRLGVARCVCLLFLAFHTADATAGQLLMQGSTLAVFTNLASRLLKSDLGLDASAIQVYPTNQYSPAVHRVLQISANLADAAGMAVSTGGMYYPPIFRPLFKKNAGPDGAYSVLITGFEEVHEASQGLGPDAQWIDLEWLSAESSMEPRAMVYGIPWVIAARKGLPNFNEFVMYTSMQATRRLEFRRAQMSGPITETNVMHLLSISNTFGMEAWNSYSNTYPNGLRMEARVDVFATLTNETGRVLLEASNSAVSILDIPAGSWAGYTNPGYALESFRLPFVVATNIAPLLPRSIYRESSRFESVTNAGLGFEWSTNGAVFPVPRWLLNLRTRARFLLVDINSGRVVDFVNLNKREEPLDITYMLHMDGCLENLCGDDGSMWSTNRLWDTSGTNLHQPTWGIINQIAASLGEVEAINWLSDPQNNDKPRAQAFFASQFQPYYPAGPYRHTNLFYAPFTAQRTVHYATSWSANDPLVHYTIGDLEDYRDTFQTNRIRYYPPGASNSIGVVNRRLRPWGGSPLGLGSDEAATDLSLKDGMVTRSDDWNFPTNGLDVTSLGRVHRGTPWQTVYLKSRVAQPQLWGSWLGWQKWPGGAMPAHPTNDWTLVSMLAPSLNTNPATALRSLNQRTPGEWAQLFDGLVAQSNSWRFEQTALMHSNSPQAEIMSAALDLARKSTPTKHFANLGQLLSVPELSASSPWLNVSTRWLTEAALEAVPAQLLPLLRSDSIGTIAPSAEMKASFTGWDNAAYSLQISSNLVDWTTISTHYPSNGVFQTTVPVGGPEEGTFLRSRLVQ